MPVGAGRSSPMMFHPLFVLLFNSPNQYSRLPMYFLRSTVYYRFHRIHSRMLFLHSPSSIPPLFISPFSLPLQITYPAEYI
jgi:hypothetical protein